MLYNNQCYAEREINAGSQEMDTDERCNVLRVFAARIYYRIPVLR